MEGRNACRVAWGTLGQANGDAKKRSTTMGSLHERNPSLWVGTTPETDYPPLRGEVAVDVAVIGGGITGLTTATLLKRAGATVAVIEAGRIAAGTTGYTTAKVTSLHSLIYAELVRTLGVERARIYADANQAGVAWVADFVRESGIACDLARLPALTYTDDPERVADIEAEVDASSAAWACPPAIRRRPISPIPCWRRCVSTISSRFIRANTAWVWPRGFPGMAVTCSK